MGLKLKLKPDERVYIAGALIRNAGSGAVLELMNEVPMLREKDILLEGDAKTPCQKLYLIVQTLYFEEASRATLFKSFETLWEELVSAAPSLSDSLTPIRDKVIREDYYPALKDLQKTITYEAELMSYAKQSN